jgi:hypothetical protein
MDQTIVLGIIAVLSLVASVGLVTQHMRERALLRAALQEQATSEGSSS